MARRVSAPSRLVAASLIDWTGTGFYVAVSAIFLTRSVGLTPGEAGLARPVAARRGRGGPPAQIARMRLLRGLCSTSARPSFSSTGGT